MVHKITALYMANRNMKNAALTSIFLIRSMEALIDGAMSPISAHGVDRSYKTLPLPHHFEIPSICT
jgi:hypothetical protein